MICNDPSIGSGHLPDIFMVMPVHLDGDLIGYVVDIAHHIDVGAQHPAARRSSACARPARRGSASCRPFCSGRAPAEALGERGTVKASDNPVVGRWRIVEADLWDGDHLDLCGPAHLSVRADGVGEIAFGASITESESSRRVRGW